ncbi:MAG: hypothetical protein ACRCUY_00795 [Thermoguttaceae bacterium]
MLTSKPLHSSNEYLRLISRHVLTKMQVKKSDETAIALFQSRSFNCAGSLAILFQTLFTSKPPRIF